MGFTQLTEQGSEASSDSETTEVVAIVAEDSSEVDAAPTASPDALAYAQPMGRPAPQAEELAETAASATSQPPNETTAVPASAEQTPAQSAAVVVEAKVDEAEDVGEPSDAAAADASPPKKRGLLSSIFGARSEKQEQEQTAKPESDPVKEAQVAAARKLYTASTSESKPTIDAAAISAAYSADVLPGVRGKNQLFEIRSADGADDSDVDLYEEEGSYQVASAMGLARLAPHGLLKQRDDVDTSCFKPQLVRLLKMIEGHYRKPVVVTSGYRSPAHNRRVRGARRSAHMDCAAADIQVAGVSRWELAKFARSLPGRGGVGTYCHTASVHVDVGRERDWNWRCRK